MEISHVRNQLKHAMERARDRAQQRRGAHVGGRARLRDIPAGCGDAAVTKQVANALKAEGYAFTLFTPGGGLRLRVRPRP